jgi:hypothetical protein
MAAESIWSGNICGYGDNRLFAKHMVSKDDQLMCCSNCHLRFDQEVRPLFVWTGMVLNGSAKAIRTNKFCIDADNSRAGELERAWLKVNVPALTAGNAQNLLTFRANHNCGFSSPTATKKFSRCGANNVLAERNENLDLF